MSDTQYVFDVTESEFESVINRSNEALVLIDFWAPWCAPCRSLGPILEKLAGEYAGRLLVAKMNTDENQVIPGQIGVRSLPTVIFLKDGQMAHQFVGAQPEHAIRQMIEALIGPAGEAEPEVEEPAIAADVQAELQQVAAKLESKPDDPELRAELADWLTQAGEFEAAREICTALAESQADNAHLKRANARLYFADAAGLDADDELSTILVQAAQEALAGEAEAAAASLLDVMRRDRQFRDDAGRTGLVHLLELVDDAKLAGQVRRKMSSLLF